jgi:hypothetical protein
MWDKRMGGLLWGAGEAFCRRKKYRFLIAALRDGKVGTWGTIFGVGRKKQVLQCKGMTMSER